MTIGLVLLAIVAILIFFGVSERFFRDMGLSNWLAFLLVLALVVGAIVPNINIAGAFSMNIGGFIVPLIIMTVLFAAMRSGRSVLATLPAMLAVAAVAVATRMLIEPLSSGLILASSLIVGFAGGMAAFLTGRGRLSTLASAIGGIILGDVVTNFLYVYALGDYTFTLGSYGVFDSVVLASIFGILVYEAVSAIKKTALSHSKSTARGGAELIARTAFEAGEDTITDSSEGGGSEGGLDNGLNDGLDAAGADEYEIIGAGEIDKNDNCAACRVTDDKACDRTNDPADSFFDDFV